MEVTPGDRLLINVNGVNYPLIITEVFPDRIQAGGYTLAPVGDTWQILNYPYTHTVSLVPRGAFLGPRELDWNFLLGLPLETLDPLCLTNTQIQTICRDEEFWREKVDRFYGVSRYKPEGITYQSQLRTFNPTLTPSQAIQMGRPDLLAYLIRSGTPASVKMANEAALFGQVETLNLLDRMRVLPNLFGLRDALLNSHLDVAEWIVQHEIRPTTQIADIFAGRGRLDLLEWLEQKGILPGPFGAQVAEFNGYGRVVGWLQQRGIEPIPV